MENTDGNASTAGGMEPADSSSAAADLDGIQSSDPLAVAEAHLERAESQLRYGRRQEAESALDLIAAAQECIAEARSALGQR